MKLAVISFDYRAFEDLRIDRAVLRQASPISFRSCDCGTLLSDELREGRSIKRRVVSGKTERGETDHAFSGEPKTFGFQCLGLNSSKKIVRFSKVVGLTPL